MVSRKLLSLFLTMTLCAPLLLFTAVSGKALSHDLYVAPDGNDAASGSKQGPLATLKGAKEKAKEHSGSVTVWFREGTYTIDETIRFTGEDKSDVTYKAYPGETVVFTAGRAYTGFEECTVNGVRAFCKNVGTDADFNVLMNGETTLERPRYPESGYFYVRSTSESDDLTPEEPTEVLRSYRAMTVDPADVPALKNAGDVVIRILHYWKDEMLTIRSYDAANGYMTFSRPSSMKVAAGDRYFLENVFEALDQPGEWYLDRPTGTLYYVPFPGETAESLTLWGAETETMIAVNGADGISFENIIFRGNGFSIPCGNTERDISSQAAYDATPCVSYENAADFAIRNCEFRDIAACAVFFGKGVRNATVDSSYFENLGAQAVYVRGVNKTLDDPDVTKDIHITNNCVSGYGKVFYNAVGVLVIHANAVEVSHNEIHDGYYTAISVGWVWGYGYNITYDNKICDNLIYNIGQGWLSDMGGIYTLGVQPGTVISGNVIHNVAADPGKGGYGGWGIYLDEGSSQILVEKNLVFACGSDGYHLHYGDGNTIRNNIFALNGESQIRTQTRHERQQTADFSRNILLTDQKVCAFSYLLETDAYTEDGNIFWDLTNGDEIYVSEKGSSKNVMSLRTAERKGYIHNALVADPMFKDAASFDFSIDADSPVLSAGFESWDYTNAGTLTGTTIGLSHAGGQTAYNAEASAQSYTAVSSPWIFLRDFLLKIIAFFKKLFQ